jgi:predicted LPLAT superfamily acyltransferase
MTAAAAHPEWLKRSERSNPAMMKFMVWVALKLGRNAARALLYPISLYYVLFSPIPRAASKQFLTRALGRAPRLTELYRHHFFLAACLLDRIFFLDGQFAKFDVQVHGEEIAAEALAQGKGCILIGAHFGSFEVVRALGRNRPDLQVALLMYQENARNIAEVAAAINPTLAAEIIALGQPDSMLKIMDRLDAGGFIGILADRTFETEGRQSCSFLGQPAAFPLGPFRLASVLRRPVVLMLGLYKGGSRYDIHFETLGDGQESSKAGSRAMAEAMLHRYVARLEYYARLAPYNWFNFYDIWK